LTGEVGIGVGQPPADQLQEGIGVILVFVAAGDLVDTLADERPHAVPHRATPPVGDAASRGGAHAQHGIGFGRPRQIAVAGEATAVERRPQRHAVARGEANNGHSRLRHRSTVRIGCLSNSDSPAGASLSPEPRPSAALMNNPG
jgi:hypothetical protein